MLARIGLPGNGYHTFARFATRAECEEWARKQLESGRFPRDAKFGVLTERTAATCRYRDGSKCYPRG